MSQTEMTNYAPLYLHPLRTPRLSVVLKKLEAATTTNAGSKLTLQLIRNNLFELVRPLSPLSNTRRLAEELLDLTKECPPSQKRELERIISAIRDIYKTGRINKRDDSSCRPASGTKEPFR